jgi:hypothetical protein
MANYFEWGLAKKELGPNSFMGPIGMLRPIDFRFDVWQVFGAQAFGGSV